MRKYLFTDDFQSHHSSFMADPGLYDRGLGKGVNASRNKVVTKNVNYFVGG